MSSGRSIFFILYGRVLVFSSIRFDIFSSQKFFVFTMPKVRGVGVRGVGVSEVVWSKLSWPLIMSKISFASSEVFVSGPMQSKDIVMSISPYRETAP